MEDDDDDDYHYHQDHHHHRGNGNNDLRKQKTPRKKKMRHCRVAQRLVSKLAERSYTNEPTFDPPDGLHPAGGMDVGKYTD